MLQIANVLKSNFYTTDRLPCFGCQNVQKMTIKTWKNECTRQLTRMMDLMPSDFTAVHSTLPACAKFANQQNVTWHDERFNFSTIFSGCQIKQVRVTLKSNQAQ